MKFSDNKTPFFSFIQAVFLLVTLLILTIPIVSQSQTIEILYDKKCGRCHTAYEPSDFSKEDWPTIVRSMKSQAALTEQEIVDLTEYLQQQSEPEGIKISQRPTLGGYLYTEYFQTPEAVKNFDIHYLAFYASGWAKENIYYFGEFELEHGGTGGSNTFVEQAYLDYWITPNLAVKVGAMLTPFNRFDEFHDPLLNTIITRPQMSREIGVSAWKDVGVDFHGYFNLNPQLSASFDLYTINGLGSGSNLRGSRQYRDNNEDKAFGGRLNLMIQNFLEIGGSVYNGAWDDEGKYDLNMIGGHFLLNTQFADFYGEYAKATSENPTGSEDGDISGFFIQASRLIKNKYRPTIRFGELDYLDTGNIMGRSASKGNKDLQEIAFGFSFYPTSKVAFKVEYTLFKEGDRVSEKDNDQLGLQTAIKF
jgi:hypothetical protein